MVREPPSTEDILSRRLQDCKPGNDDFPVYETACCDSIEHLFNTDFRLSKRQHTTTDGMFRMDLQCSLKRNTEFWQFLFEEYKCRIAVFDFKNYTDSIGQNEVFITQKYLNPKYHRSVAFIVSHRGFTANAMNAVKDILLKSDQLIIDLTDDDLIAMLEMKKCGADPSEYLMRKVELMFMSFS